MNPPDDLDHIQLLKPHLCALVVVDLQHDYCHSDGVLGDLIDSHAINRMCSTVGALQQSAHDAAVPVIFLQTIHRHATDSPGWRRRLGGHVIDLCREGTWGSQFHECHPSRGDVVVQKHRYSGFHGTELTHVLRALDRTTVVLTGTATNVCVESTARDAAMFDYDVVVVDDATCAASEAEHQASLANITKYFGTVVNSNMLLDTWQNQSHLGRSERVS